MAKKATAGTKKGTGRRSGGATGSVETNSLVGNINRRKTAGKSRSKKDSTISDKPYKEMQKGWPETSGPKKTKKRKS